MCTQRLLGQWYKPHYVCEERVITSCHYLTQTCRYPLSAIHFIHQNVTSTLDRHWLLSSRLLNLSSVSPDSRNSLNYLGFTRLTTKPICSPPHWFTRALWFRHRANAASVHLKPDQEENLIHRTFRLVQLNQSCRVKLQGLCQPVKFHIQVCSEPCDTRYAAKTLKEFNRRVFAEPCNVTAKLTFNLFYIKCHHFILLGIWRSLLGWVDHQIPNHLILESRVWFLWYRLHKNGAYPRSEGPLTAVF